MVLCMEQTAGAHMASLIASAAAASASGQARGSDAEATATGEVTRGIGDATRGSKRPAPSGSEPPRRPPAAPSVLSICAQRFAELGKRAVTDAPAGGASTGGAFTGGAFTADAATSAASVTMYEEAVAEARAAASRDRMRADELSRALDPPPSSSLLPASSSALHNLPEMAPSCALAVTSGDEAAWPTGLEASDFTPALPTLPPAPRRAAILAASNVGGGPVRDKTAKPFASLPWPRVACPLIPLAHAWHAP